MPSRPTSKRTVASDRRRRVAKLRLQGMSLEDIAIRLGWSIGTIYADCKHLETAWAREAETDTYQKHVSMQLKKLALLQQEAWAAWYRSLNRKGKLKEIRRRAKKLSSGSPDASPEDMVILIKSGAGDPRFLAIIQRSIEEENILKKIRQPDLTSADGDVNSTPPLSIEVARDDAGDAIMVTSAITHEEAGEGDVIEGSTVVDGSPVEVDISIGGSDEDTDDADEQAAR